MMATFMSAPVFAQIRLGGVADLNLATLSTDTQEYSDVFESRTCLGAGAVVELELGRNFSLVVEPMLLGKGANFHLGEAVTVVSGSVNLTYVEVPLFAKYAFGQSGFRPYVLAGPTVGFKAGAKLVT
jgi:hypothetical protein